MAILRGFAASWHVNIILARLMDEKQQIIRDEMRFLLEPEERWFEKHLCAHLLDEGCNLPLVLAKPRFYTLMISGLCTRGNLPAASLPFVDSMDSEDSLKDHCSNYSHRDFYKAMRFFAAALDAPGIQMALEVTASIRTIVQEWLLTHAIFQEDIERFTSRVKEIMTRLCETNGILWESMISFDMIRRRLYLALTTALLSKMNVRAIFVQEFGTIPSLLQAMCNDHAEFCRFMALCQEHTPYFPSLASRSFWRTLETLRLEYLHETS